MLLPVILDITHNTTYRFAQPVVLGEHYVQFRPRDSHDLRVLTTNLQVTPQPKDVRMFQDAYGNCIALIQPQSPASSLQVLCSSSVEHTGTHAVNFPMSLRAQRFPLAYDDEERLVLSHYLHPFYDDPTGMLQNWANRFLHGEATSTRALLADMTQFIRSSMQYLARHAPGVQTPYDTLRLQSGTCRDFATLMVEAVRRLGYAARFVSGYLYTPWLDSGEAQHNGTGSTHAWVQVFLPEAGWLPFDPTNNLIGGTDLITVGVSRHASVSTPVSGSWSGFPGDFLAMDVDVKVHKRIGSNF